MTLLSTTLLAFSMSTDAFAAAIGKGATLEHPRFREALRTGLLFGIIEGITPLIGWVLGYGASRYIVNWDHWVIFAILLLLGGRMILAGLTASEPAETSLSARRHTWWLLAATAVATSIDALAIGIGLAFIDDVNILVIALAIGLATTLMATIGVMLGKRLGALIGHRAELLGGIILIGIGTTILFDHLAIW